VFNLELEEGLEASYLTLRDEDAYDSGCDHSAGGKRRRGRRHLPDADGYARRRRHIGFYSAQEFDLSPFEPIRAQVLELGRACVHSEHRNSAGALAAVARHCGVREGAGLPLSCWGAVRLPRKILKRASLCTKCSPTGTLRPNTFARSRCPVGRAPIPCSNRIRPPFRAHPNC
jgi:hypothetical protein